MPQSEQVVPALRFPEFKDVWNKKNFGELGTFKGGGTPDTNTQSYWTGDIPWVSSSDIIEDNIHHINITRYITSEAVKNSATKLIPKNTILLVSRVGVGKFGVTSCELCTSQDFSNFTPNKDNTYFIAYWLSQHKNKLLSLSQGTSIKGFTSDDLKSLQICLPSSKEQQKIASSLTAVDEKIAQLQKKKDLLEEYKKGCMQKLFSQELRFKDDNGTLFPDWEEKKLAELELYISDGNYGEMLCLSLNLG